MIELNGKTALVTGAAQGIGHGVALALAKAGAAVGLVDLQEEKLQALAAKIAGFGGKVLPLACDITDRNAVNQAVAKVSRAFGPVWALVNVAIATDNKPVEEVDDANLDLVLRSGIYATLYMMQACFPAMRQHGGRIINFGSGSATMGLPHACAYNIAKEGVRGLTKTAAVGWGQYGITVNTICPMAATPLFQTWWDSLSEADRAHELSLIPMRRTGDAEADIGATVVFLASDGAGYMTGRTLHVDGGRAYYDR